MPSCCRWPRSGQGQQRACVWASRWWSETHPCQGLCRSVYIFNITMQIFFTDCTYSALATAMEIHAVFPARVVRPVWKLPLWCCSLHLPPRCLPPSWSLRRNGRMTTRTIVMAFDLTVLYPFETSLHRLHCYSFYIASLVSKMS